MRPESLTSLVPTTVSVEAVSALASDGATSRKAAVRRPTRGTARSRRNAPGWSPDAPGRARWRREMEVLRIAGAYRHCLCTRETRDWGRVRLWRRVGPSECSHLASAGARGIANRTTHGVRRRRVFEERFDRPGQRDMHGHAASDACDCAADIDIAGGRDGRLSGSAGAVGAVG